MKDPCQLKVYYQHSWAVCCVHELNMASCCEAGAPQLFFSGKKWEVEKWWEKADDKMLEDFSIWHIILYDNQESVRTTSRLFSLPDILRLPKIKSVLGERKAASISLQKQNTRDWLPSPDTLPGFSSPTAALDARLSIFLTVRVRIHLFEGGFSSS